MKHIQYKLIKYLRSKKEIYKLTPFTFNAKSDIYHDLGKYHLRQVEMGHGDMENINTIIIAPLWS